MQVITYLAFTLLSIAIQFVVMDLIQARIKVNDESIRKIDLNNTSPKKSFSDILQHYAQRPHALYYQAKKEKLVDKAATTVNLSTYTRENISSESSTDLPISTTVVDLLYDENTTVTEESSTTVTETMYTTTEFDFDNITEITLFNSKKNKTDVKPKNTPKTVVSKDCSCNLLYTVCDVNCCCDDECTEYERNIFKCSESALRKENTNFCYTQFSFVMGSNIDDLFCVVKSNLPDKRNIAQKKHDPLLVAKHFKWHANSKLKPVQEYTKEMYKYGDPIWLLRNSTIYYVDLPSPMVNSYCSERKPIRFLRAEKIKCIVKLTDLELFQILSTAEQTSVISVTEKSMNSSALNCTTLHCTNWTIILCNELTCTKFNRSVHDPLCTENICTDLALKISYTFHYYQNKIMNATIKLFTQKVPLTMPFIEQELSVRFVIANESVNDIIEYSGNPGYIAGLPIIVSYAKANHTESFFNDTSKMKKRLFYPDNVHGICDRLNTTNNFIAFGTNKRTKCRFVAEQKAPHRNVTNACKNIQKQITLKLGFGRNIAVSPLGNPHGLVDRDWFQLPIDIPEEIIYGELNAQKTKMYCYNVVNRYSFVFSFADVSDQPATTKLKLLSAKFHFTASNVTFKVEDISTVVTVDSVFIDETKLSVVEYAGGPQLNIHLPRDFFFPFPSNNACIYILTKSLILFNLFVVIIK
ncbi:hypothetical protein O0L34_g1241 [Tuta absoluta]|nr:hypothetical protein O0L34_g1241 [Tuta absoluta]